MGKISGEEGWISLGPWGAKVGVDWTYKPDGPILEITIAYGIGIESIIFQSKSCDGVAIGKSVEIGDYLDPSMTKTKTLCIDSSREQLLSISLTYEYFSEGYFNDHCGRHRIISLCFDTNLKKYGPFGWGLGSGNFSVSIPIKGGVFAGFHGRSEDGYGIINAIGIFVAPIANSLPSSEKKVDSLHIVEDPDSTPTQLKGKISDEKGLISLGPWGGKDGVDWAYKLDGPIMQIIICYGEAINSILFRSRSSDGFVIGSSEKIGGTGGDMTEMV